MIGARVLFSLKDEVKERLANIEDVKKHLSNVIELAKKVPGLKEKFFIMDPKTLAQGAFLIWETQKDFDEYRKSDQYKTTVLDICKGKPNIETYVLSATLKDGVLL
jgi:hypothetical protein